MQVLSRVFPLIFVVLLVQCQKDDEDSCDPVTASELPGQWDDLGDQMHGYGGQQYFFTFEPDSFYFHKILTTDVMHTDCEPTLSWDIYAKGTYELEDSELSLNGFYCDSNYNRLMTSSCPEVIDTGAYSQHFNVVEMCDETLRLLNYNFEAWHDTIHLRKN